MEEHSQEAEDNDSSCEFVKGNVQRRSCWERGQVLG